MIKTLAGTNRLELSRRLKELLEAFMAEHGELAVERLDGQEVDAQAIIDAVQSAPFLSAKKLVVVRNLSANKTAAEQIEQIIDSSADSTDLIFYEPSTDKRTVFYKALKKKTELEEHGELAPAELPRWMVAAAKASGGALSLADAAYLVERVGANQQLLASELEKLLTYDSNVSRDSIDLLTEKAPQSKVFDLLDAAFSGNKARALQLYEEQRIKRIEPQEILAMIAWQLRLIVLAKLGQGKTADQIAGDTGTKAYPVSKAQGLARKLTTEKLRTMVAEAEKIDRLSKSKPIDLDEAIKTYITTL